MHKEASRTNKLNEDQHSKTDVFPNTNSEDTCAQIVTISGLLLLQSQLPKVINTILQ